MDLILYKLRSQAVSRQGRLVQKGRVSKAVEIRVAGRRCVRRHTDGPQWEPGTVPGREPLRASGAWPCPS